MGVRASYSAVDTRNQYARRVPPLLPPLSHIRSQKEKYEIFCFFGAVPNVYALLETPCPPLFAPPFYIFGKFKHFATNFVFIILPQNALVWLHNPISNKQIRPVTM